MCGCTPNEMMRDALEKIAPDDDEKLAKEHITALRLGDMVTVMDQLDPQIKTPNIEQELEVIGTYLSQGEPISVELVGCNVFTNSGKRRSNITYQYEFENAWILAAVTIDTAGGNKTVVGVNVNPIPNSLESLNAFTLNSKSLQHYVFALLAVFIPLFIIFVLVLCVRTKLQKRKWLWIIFILFGLGKMGLNWSTGEILFNPLSINFQLFGSGVFKQGPYAPWILSLSLPLGAIIFLIRRKSLMIAEPATSLGDEVEQS